jgi:hypothetical protein
MTDQLPDEWGLEPPRLKHAKPARKGHRFHAVALEMRRNPGLWCKVTEQEPHCYSKQQRMQKGAYAAFRPVGHWSFVVRQSSQVTREDGKILWVGDIWGRYEPVKKLPKGPKRRAPLGGDADPYELLYQQIDAHNSKINKGEKK